MTENEAIEEIIMSKMKEECVQVNIDYEWRKVVCLDDIGHIIRSELRKLTEELQQYRSIGTVEECRAAVERLETKKPIKQRRKPTDAEWEELADLGFCGGDIICCPNCGEYIVINKLKHCMECGQALDWNK